MAVAIEVKRVRRHTPNAVERLRKVLLFIHEFKERNDYSPDHREIGVAVGISSTSVVSYYLDELAEEGMIAMEKKKSRTVRLTDRGKEFAAALLFRNVDAAKKIHVNAA